MAENNVNFTDLSSDHDAALLVPDEGVDRPDDSLQLFDVESDLVVGLAAALARVNVNLHFREAAQALQSVSVQQEWKTL